MHFVAGGLEMYSHISKALRKNFRAPRTKNKGFKRSQIQMPYD